VWILPLRATNAISEGNAQADVVNDIMISLEKYVHEAKHLKETAVSYDDVVKEAVDLLIYFIQLFNENYETTKLPEPVVNYNRSIMGEMHQGYQILVENRTFHMRQQLSLPRSLHAVCIILVIFFHGVLFPMVLFNANEWYALIYSFFSALVSSACLEIAIKEGKPYRNIFVRNANEKVNSLQKRVTRLVKNLYDLDTDKKTSITDFNTKYVGAKGRPLGKMPYLITSFKLTQNKKMQSFIKFSLRGHDSVSFFVNPQLMRIALQFLNNIQIKAVWNLEMAPIETFSSDAVLSPSQKSKLH
jgi:hypothetical protein